MVLDPLTEVCIGMLMPIGIGRRQFMMNILRHCKRCDREQQQNQSDRQTPPQ